MSCHDNRIIHFRNRNLGVNPSFYAWYPMCSSIYRLYDIFLTKLDCFCIFAKPRHATYGKTVLCLQNVQNVELICLQPVQLDRVHPKSTKIRQTYKALKYGSMDSDLLLSNFQTPDKLIVIEETKDTDNYCFRPHLRFFSYHHMNTMKNYLWYNNIIIYPNPTLFSLCSRFVEL